MNRGYIQSWNLFIQREFSPTLTAEAGYVGTHAVHQMMGVNINGSAPNTGNAGRQLAPYLTTDLNQYQPFGNLTYDALQTNVKKRFGSSLIGASYTFSRAINNYNGDNGDGTLFRAYPVSYALNKQLAGFDRTHTFQLYHVYQLPFGKGHKLLNQGPIAYVVGGFQISGTLSRFSGLPFTIGSSSAVNAGGQGQTASQINPVVQILGGHDPNTPYFDGTAFTNPPAGTLGTTGRNLLRGPGFFNVDEKRLPHLQLQGRKVQIAIRRRGIQPDQYAVVLHAERHLCRTHVEYRWLRQELRQLQRDQRNGVHGAPVASRRLRALLNRQIRC